MTDAPKRHDDSPDQYQPLNGAVTPSPGPMGWPNLSADPHAAAAGHETDPSRAGRHRAGAWRSTRATSGLPTGFMYGNPERARRRDPAGVPAGASMAAGSSDDEDIEITDDPDAPDAPDRAATVAGDDDPTWDGVDQPAASDASDRADATDTADPATEKAAAKAARKAEKEAQKRAKAEQKAAARAAKRQAKEAAKAAKRAGTSDEADDGADSTEDAPLTVAAENGPQDPTAATRPDDPDAVPPGSDNEPLAPNQEPNALPLPIATPLTPGAAGHNALSPHEAPALGDTDGDDGWTPVGATIVEDVPLDENGMPLVATDADAGDGEAVHPRLGLRLGVHQKGGIIARIKARLGIGGDQPDETQAMQQEEEEALAERIEPDERYKEVETYPIHPPYAHVRILFDDDMKEYVYQVLEPVLTRTEKEILEFVESTLVDTLSVSPEELEDADELEFITERFNDVIFDYSIILHEDEAEEVEIKKKLLYYIRRNFIGHGPIDVIMEDPYIEDISCDGPHVPIFLYHRKYESMRSTVIFGEHEVLDSYVIKMAQRAGKHISIAEPILDATMTDGSRLQSTLAKEVSAAGSTFTIRKFRPDPFTPPDLVMFRTMSAEMLAYLWISVQNGASIMYAGGTASGKTTSLNAILLFIPPNMKIVSIEDTREVNLPHENWIAGITRHGFGPRDQFGRQAGEIDMFQLLKNALRQRPEYIIVGEVRGQEAYSLFQAMATGHAAYGTMHADSVDAVIHRLESDPINIPRSLLEALDIVSVQIQTRVDGKRVRRTKQISEIVGLDPHTREILTNEVFRWQPEDDSFRFSGVSYALEKIQIEKGLPAGAMIKELKRRAQIIAWMIDRRIQNYKEVNKVVSAYYKEPETVMKLVNGELGPEEIPIGLREIAMRGDQVEENPLSATALAAAKAGLTHQPDADGEQPTAQPAAPEHDALAAARHAPHPAEPAIAQGRVTEAEDETLGEHAPEAEAPDEGPAGPGATDDGAEPTEKAHDWGGVDALLQAAEAHVTSDAAEADAEPHAVEGPEPGRTPDTEPERTPVPQAAAADDPDTDSMEEAETWLSEREREVREAKAQHDEAAEAAQRAAHEDEAEPADADGPVDAKGRRLKRGSGGDDTE